MKFIIFRVIITLSISRIFPKRKEQFVIFVLITKLPPICTL